MRSVGMRYGLFWPVRLASWIVLWAMMDAARGQQICQQGFRGFCYIYSSNATLWEPYPPVCGNFMQASIHSQEELNYLCENFTPFNTTLIDTWTGLTHPDINITYNMDGTPFDFIPAFFREDSPVPGQIRLNPAVGCLYDDSSWAGNLRGWFCKSALTRVALIITDFVDPGGVPAYGDRYIAKRLFARNWNVVLMADNNANLTNMFASGFDAIIIGPRAMNETTAARMNTLGIPIVSLSGPTLRAAGLYNNFTGSMIEISSFTFANISHPLLKGLNGTMALTSSYTLLYSNINLFGATVLARESANQVYYGIFETGATTPAGQLSGRRIVLPFDDTTMSGLYGTGFPNYVPDTMFDNVFAYLEAHAVVTLMPGPYYANEPIYFTLSYVDGNGLPLLGGFNYSADIGLAITHSGAPVTGASLTAGWSDYGTLSLCRFNTTYINDQHSPLTVLPPGMVWYFMNHTNTYFGNFTVNEAGFDYKLNFTIISCSWPLAGGTTVSDIHIWINPDRHVSIHTPPNNFTVPGTSSMAVSVKDVYGHTAIGEPVMVRWVTADGLTILNELNTTTAAGTGAIPYNFTTHVAGDYKVGLWMQGALVGYTPTVTALHSALDVFAYMNEPTATALAMGTLQILALDVYNNSYVLPITLSTVSVGSQSPPTLSGGTGTVVTPVFASGEATFSGLSFSAPGCVVVSATVTGAATPIRTETMFIQLPPTLINVVIAENIVYTYTLPWTPGMSHTVWNDTCGGNLTVDESAGTTAVLSYTALNWEVTKFCEFTLQLAGCPLYHVFNITVLNVYEPVLAPAYTLQLNTRSPLSLHLGDVVFSENVPQADLIYTLLTLPVAIYVYPKEDNITDVNKLTTPAATEADLPLVLTNTDGRATLVYNSGMYTDQMSYTVSDGVTTTTEAAINIVVNVTCPDPVGMFLSAQGYCVCSAAAFINIEGNCQECPVGTYYSGQQIANPCFACPEGAVCAGGPIAPVIQPGYYCTVGMAVPAQAYDKCTPQAACLGQCQCRTGHIGPLCGTCEPGYYKDNSLCAPCPSTSALFLTLLGIAMVFVCAALIKVARRSTTYFTSLSVGFNFLQVVSILAEFRLKWPPFVLQFLNILSVVNLNINLVQPECAFAGGTVPYFPIWMFKLCIPFIFLFIFLAAYWGARAYAIIRDNMNEIRRPWISRLRKLSKADIIVLKNACINAFFTILVLLYLNLMSTALEIYSCDADGNMIKEASYKCRSGEWYKLVAISAVASIVYGLGIPAMFYGVLQLNRMNLLKELTIIKFGLLYRRYKHELFMWEIIILWRKLGIILGLLFFGSNPVGAALFALAALVIAFGLQLYFQPYVSKRVNFLETVHLTCGSIVLMFGLILAAVSTTNDQSAITTLGVIVILIVVANCIVLFYIVFQELRYQYNLVRRGVQGGFASDEVMVNDFFFHHDFFVKEMSRNVMGTTSTIVLTSGTECALKVEYTDRKGRQLKDETRDQCLRTWVQSNGTTHVIITLFKQPGRYGLRVYARRSTDKEVEIQVDSAAATVGMNRAQRALVWIKQVYKRNDAGTIPTFAYHLNCDVRPRVELGFPKVTKIAERKGLVLLHPNFFELTPQARTTFRLLGSPINCVLSPVRPKTQNEAGVISFTPPKEPIEEPDDAFFVTATTFARKGPVHLWCQFSLPKVHASSGVGQQAFARPHLGPQGYNKNDPTAALASLGSVSGDAFAELDGGSTNFGSVNNGRASGFNFANAAAVMSMGMDMTPGALSSGLLGLAGDEEPVIEDHDDDDVDVASYMASEGQFVRVASFEVLEQHAGWTESGIVESEIMGLLIKDDSKTDKDAGVEMDIANPVFQLPPVLGAPFTSRRGVLYTPRTRDLPINVAHNFEVVLPGATVFIIKQTKPQHDADGQVMFKREDNVYCCVATFSATGPLYIWVRLATLETNSQRLSTRPTISDFVEVVEFNLVEQ